MLHKEWGEMKMLDKKTTTHKNWIIEKYAWEEHLPLIGGLPPKVTHKNEELSRLFNKNNKMLKLVCIFLYSCFYQWSRKVPFTLP